MTAEIKEKEALNYNCYLYGNFIFKKSNGNGGLKNKQKYSLDNILYIIELKCYFFLIFLLYPHFFTSFFCFLPRNYKSQSFSEKGNIVICHS